jgi:hypothetical protein
MDALMNALRKKLLLVAAAGAATWAFTQSPAAQTVDHIGAVQSAMEEAIKEMGVRPNPSGAAHDKADATMTTPNSLPTEADKKAAAAMSK